MSAATSSSSPRDGADAASAAAVRRRRIGRGRGQVLAVAWLHEQLHVCTLGRSRILAQWTSPTAVGTLDDLAAALDHAMAHLEFAGGEVHLLLEQDWLQHRLETAPAGSEAAAATYLRSLVSRLEATSGPLLWASEVAGRGRRDAIRCLHLLPAPWYRKHDDVMRSRRLRLTRLVPLTLALQLELQALPEAQEAPVLLAAATGRATVLIAGRAHQPLLLARVIPDDWNPNAARVGTEINRSIFYAKQQFGAIIQTLVLRGPTSHGVLAEIRARCPGTPVVTEGPADVGRWLLAVSALGPRHRLNLLGGILRQNHRLRLVRQALIACCWLGFAVTGLDALREHQRWQGERTQLAELEASVPRLRAERQRLLERNERAEHNARLARAIEQDRLPPVPAGYLAYVASLTPPDIRLTAFAVRDDPGTGRWGFYLEGVVEGSPDTARDRVAGWQELLRAGPFRHQFMNTQPLPGLPPSDAEDLPRTRFSMEGELFAP